MEKFTITKKAPKQKNRMARILISIPGSECLVDARKKVVRSKKLYNRKRMSQDSSL